MAYMRRLLPLLLSLRVRWGPDPLIRCEDFAELFAGEQSVTNGLRCFGFEGIPMDQKYGCDLLSAVGFAAAVVAILKIRCGGILWAAPPCSSWVWISRGSTGRTKDNVLGNVEYTSVRMSNRLVSRVAHLVWLAVRRKVFVIIEQPMDSLLWEHPRMKKLLLRYGLRDVRLELGAYGALTPKPLILKTNVPWGEELRKTLTPEDRCKLKDLCERADVQVCKRRKDENGKVRTSGGRDLKATQAYPLGFGATIGKCHRRFCDSEEGKVVAASKVPEDIWTVPGMEEDDSDLEDEFWVQEGDECLDDVLLKVT